MAGKRGGRGGSAGAKRPAVEAEQGISSLKDSEDSKEALLDAELDIAEEHEGDAATKKEDKSAANSLPQPKTEIDCETEDANLDDTEQDLDDDDIQIIKTVLMEKIPRPLKQEPVLKKEPLKPQLSIKKDPRDEVSSINVKTDTREPLLSITNRSPTTAGSSTSALLASIQDGPRMPLKDWYEEYDVPDRTQAKLEEWGVVNAPMIARMTAAHQEAAKLDDVDRLILETAVSLWQKAGQATWDGVAEYSPCIHVQ
ncbi:hypothetical protein V8E36_002909 [Tilletia maclaganii]